MSSSSGQYELAQAPSDGVSRVRFHTTDRSLLLVSSWDQRVRLYNVHTNELVASQHEHLAAVLDTTFGGQGEAYSGGLDRRLLKWDENYTQVKELGKHEGEISCIEFNFENKVLVSGSWDKTIKLWDTNANSLEHTINCSERVYSLSTQNDKLVVGLAGRKFEIYDIRKPTVPFEVRDSPLKYPTRCVKIMPDAQGFICGSVEGRVAVEYFSDSPSYAFKCHRQTIDGVDLVYPVNAISFHPGFGTFVTGGSDGVVSIWDPVNKKRLKQYPRFETSIASLDFNCTGDTLAIASSYVYDEGEKSHPPDTIWIKPIAENEARPKVKKSSA